MVFVLPELPYNYDALTPYIDERTMHLHHDMHHQTYVDKLNALLVDYPEFANWPIEKILTNLDKLPEKLRTPVRNQAGGHYNHSLFWKMLSPDFDQKIDAGLLDRINKEWGNLQEFKNAFSSNAVAVFGSGWTWLVMKPDGKLQIVSTMNQDSPISIGLTPLLGIDLWEHAYYLKYENRRPEYIKAFWHVVNWAQVAENMSQSSLSEMVM
ncbi:MAG: superoxide dismutase [Oenococcus sp.]|uniref:superoxide dismutase n=1 Tax=Oenococcus TaxID=46254 RepID=UPI0021E8A03A|nr:superoxide dismutase [Oenococcus kitaharae]MCV3295961.1 superoxide dismutase [Oenococcus kitaharae]